MAEAYEHYEKLNTIRKAIRAGLNVMLIGPHGIGKTDAVQSLVKSEFPQYRCVYMNVSQTKRDDLLVPFPVERHGRRWVSYIPHEKFDTLDEQDGVHKPIVLILDELNRNLEDPDIQNALLEILHNRSLNGTPLDLHSIIGLANPSNDKRYFNTTEIEVSVRSRFHIKLKVDMYDLGADRYLLEKYPDHAPAVIEWVLQLPPEKRWLVPPRTQEHIIQVFLLGEPIRYVFDESDQLPIGQLEAGLRSGKMWTYKRMLHDPNGAARELQSNPVLTPLFVTLLRMVQTKRDARTLQPVLAVLPEPLRLGLWRHDPDIWTDVITSISQPQELQ